ncbi:BamA/TamA family outer membrane protein [Olivibacter sp. XZL3]|uniref:translocation and assembly module lipoprotein TamL n=1 Tax=Olivibacter sp. XZL3 TaxID=1735116 RepID=UPI001F0F9B0E|nr:BamA/TamA family outer membrane protein [Olivibacter sp. XZL3]
MLASVLFTSCRSTRLLNDDQALVTKVKLNGINKEFKEGASEYIQREIRPNSKINLFIYNFANSKNGKYRTDKIRNVGESPSILDSSLVEISRSQIQRFLASKGYFNAAVTSHIFIKRKKAHIHFDVQQGGVFKIRYIEREIADPQVDSLYRQHITHFQTLHPGMRFDTDSLVKERESIYSLMKRNGYYDYVRQYVRFEVDTNMNSSQADLRLFIDNPEGKRGHTVFKIDSSFVVIKNSNGELGDSEPAKAKLPNGLEVADYTHRFRPKPLARYIYPKKGDIFDIEKENLTYDRLYELNSFRGIRATYEKKDSTNLIVNYELTPMKRMSNRVEGEYVFTSGRSGFNIGNTYTNRNLFGGSEQLEIKARYGILFDSQLGGPLWSRIWNRDLQFGANLSIPRLIVPFPIPLMGKNGMPHTVFSTNWQIFDQLNTYSNRYVINSVSYNWYDTKYKLHSVTPISLEYRLGRLDNTFKDSLQNAGYELYVKSNDRAYFGIGSQYTYTFNTLRLNTYDNFLYFRGLLDLSGNTLNLLSKLISFRKNDIGQNTIFNVPYLQYIKSEVDFRVYRYLGGERQFVARINAGIGVPFGNNQEFLIFEKQFFGGGMNDQRAWQARTLGPGNYNRAVLTTELRNRLRNLDQLGEIKIVSNFEYRFKLLNNFFGAKLKGATFTDIGNIWRLKESVENPGGEFKFNKFLGQMAIGAGAGLRFDLQYFVFRFDAGIKVKDPQFEGADQWVIRDLFNSREFKRNYQLTNGPDPYNFIQYNFGIGMPF